MPRRQAFPPGEYLADELTARGWSQSDLARVIGRPAHHVNMLIHGRRRITSESARELADALGTGHEIWLNLQAAWDAYNVPEPRKAIQKRAAILMQRRARIVA
jgi:HTH-type transcriptional regulator / antitoxin HigA